MMNYEGWKVMDKELRVQDKGELYSTGLRGRGGGVVIHELLHAFMFILQYKGYTPLLNIFFDIV